MVNRFVFRKMSMALMATSAAMAVNAQDNRPNILLILADDLGFSDLGCYGSEINTPNLDRLASQGIRFNRFYNCGRSCPTRASLLTGLYPHEAGIGRMTFDQKLPGYRGTMTHDGVTIAEVLKDAGYATGMIGKWHVAETPLRADQRDWLNHQVFHDTFTKLEDYPVNRGFESFYGTIYGVVDYYDPFSLVDGEKPIKEVPKDYYSTIALTDSAVQYVKRYAEDDKPFFMYLAYHAPHWPLMAPERYVKKYEDVYKAGWKAIRDKRYERMQKLGLFAGQTDYLSERQSKKEWADNADAEWDARAMAVHAAMIDCMDEQIGRVIAELERTGQLQNTLIMFLSDNGCSPEVCQNFEPGENDRPDMTRDGRQMIYPKKKEVMPGPETTYASLGPLWANVANAPFRFWKAKMYEGGICTPAIAYWPEGIKAKSGSIVDSPAHVIDLMTTFTELGKADYPTTYNGNRILPMEGESLVPVFKKGKRKGHKYIGFEHFREKAFMSRDGWKIVQPGDKAPWELYNLNEDRSEQHNVASKYPKVLKKLINEYNKWADATMVNPAPK
jgi:arylsulfatase A-like enzyme